MVNGTSFSFCVVTSVITHAVCNSIFSVFRQIWDSNCSFMKGLCSHRKDRWHQSLKRAIWALLMLNPRLLEGGSVFDVGVTGIQDQGQSPSFFPGSSMLP